MKALIANNKMFYYMVLAFWSALLLVLFLTAKGEALLYINQYHSVALDYMFYFITFLGDGIFATLYLIALFLFVSKRKALVITFSFLTVVLVVQLLKNFLFADGSPRPSIFFEGLSAVYYVPWVEVHRFNSFPSGHTAQAFCLALCTLFYLKNKAYALPLFSLAALAAFSRMYLLQHFPLDLLAGSAAAIVIGTVAFYFFENKAAFLKGARADAPLIQKQKA